jgi:hypothetical protein
MMTGEPKSPRIPALGLAQAVIFSPRGQSTGTKHWSLMVAVVALTGAFTLGLVLLKLGTPYSEGARR